MGIGGDSMAFGQRIVVQEVLYFVIGASLICTNIVAGRIGLGLVVLLLSPLHEMPVIWCGNFSAVA